MPSSAPLPAQNLSDKRKHRRRASADDAALVKAAAWAWYQHGSGSERPLREFDKLERTGEKVQKPSRYKLEAIREVEESKRNHQHSSSTIPILLSTSPYISSLLDKYEIQRISLQLDRYIENSHAEFCYGVLDSGLRRVASLSESDTSERKNKKPPPSSSFKGFWLRSAVMCGSSSTDVVETGSIGRSSRWAPRGKYIFPAVKTVGCGPRASCI